MYSFTIGDEAWILEAGRYPRPVLVQKIAGSMCRVRFTDRNVISGAMIRLNRLYPSREEALACALPQPEDRSNGYYTDKGFSGKQYYED